MEGEDGEIGDRSCVPVWRDAMTDRTWKKAFTDNQRTR
jgi:hypothetical protein